MKIFKQLIFGIIGFIIGAFCSMLFYQFVVSELDIEPSVKVFMFGMTAVFLSLGFAVSTQFRCLTCLTFPEFWSTAGKRAIQATIIILMLSGPIENIGHNFEEVVHLVICFKDLTINITLVGKELLLAPIQHIFFDIKTAEIDYKEKYNLSDLTEMVEVLDNEIEDEREIDLLKSENDQIDIEMKGHVERSLEVEAEQRIYSKDDAGERIEKLYRKKLAYRCEDIFNKGTLECYDVFEDQETKCYEAVTEYLGWLLCWPFKLTFICDLIGSFAQYKLCDVTKIVPDGFGETYLTVKEGLDDFSKKFKVKVDYSALTHLINVDALKSTQEELLASFERTRGYIIYFIDLLKKLLTFTFLLMIFSSIEYQQKYFLRLSFDNNYITKYFIKIDTRRKLQNRTSILPLKSYERMEFIKLWTGLRLKEAELTKFSFSVIIICIQFLVILIIYGFDHVFTRTLELIRDHAGIEIRQEGEHIFKFQITGTGFVSNLIRRIVSDIDTMKVVDVQHDTNPCLPGPRQLNPSYLSRTLFLFFILVVLSYFEAFSLRTRHVICNFFYPERSKDRIIWLYNQTLRNRTGKLKHLKEKVLRNADELRAKVDWNVFLAWAMTFPRLCCCLKYFSASQPKCVLCKESGEYYKCPKCHFSYCFECFQDVDKRCIFEIALAEEKAKMYEEIQDELDNV